MIDFQARKETFVNASPEAAFDIVADVANHNKLAGSGEVLTVRKLTDGPVGFGTVIEANEKLPVADQSMDMVAHSVIVTHDRPNSISWISSPVGLPTRRIQWFFNFTAQDGGTKVVHDVEVDFGPQTDPQMIALVENYDQIRAPYVTSGMEKTLGNLKKAAEA